MELTLYTRARCHLCEEAKATLAPVLLEFGVTLKEIDIDSDPALAARFGQDVPVLMLDTRKLAKHRIDAAQVRRALELLKKLGVTP
ncbi:MAG: glutaredoxin family protein [Candidatus Acidiferrales bacterium]